MMNVNHSNCTRQQLGNGAVEKTRPLAMPIVLLAAPVIRGLTYFSLTKSKLERSTATHVAIQDRGKTLRFVAAYRLSPGIFHRLARYRTDFKIERRETYITACN
jgi:hypothetical protein